MILLGATVFLSIGVIGCGSSKPSQSEQPTGQQQTSPRRYQLTGRVVSVDAAKQQLVVDHKEIPGFMGAMTMAYPVKNSNLLAPLAPDDEITADVVVNGDEVWLENIAVVKKAEPKSTSQSPSPSKETHTPSQRPPKL
jgi:protein SCO1/2